VQVFYQQLQQQVVEEKIGDKNKEITEQLNPPPDIGIDEHHIFHQEKANGEIDQKSKYQGSDVGFKGIKTQLENLFPEQEFIAERVQQEAKDSIGSTAGGIPECLQRQPLFKWPVKKVDDIGNLVMNHSFFFWREDNY
jgi:hypothetical protein